MLVSIVVPVFKVEQYLSRCVDSILNQTFKDFELILVDDGSPDKCGQMCDEYAKTDNRIHVIHKKNGGLSDARNAGIEWCIENSNSEWVTFIDSDDWIHPKYLEVLYKSAIRHNSSISVCGNKKTDRFLPFDDINDFEVSNMSTAKLFSEYHLEAVVAWGKLYKKEYFADVRYPLGRIHEDEFVTYKLLFQNKTISFVNLPLYFYYENAQSIMHSKWSVRKLDIIYAFKQQYEFFKKFNNEQLYIEAVERYTWELIDQYVNVNDCVDLENKEKYIKFIRHELRKCLKTKGISEDIANNKFFNEVAYPQKTKMFKFYKRVKKKINRMFKK